MRALMIVAIFYFIIGVIFYFESIGPAFITDIHSIKGVDGEIPKALAIGMVYMWLLLGLVYYLNDSNRQNKKSGQFKAIEDNQVAATEEERSWM